MPLRLLSTFRHPQPLLWTLVGGLALTGLLGWEMNREAVNLDRQRLALRVAEIQSQLDSRLEKSEMLLHNLRDYLAWSSDRSETGFQRWCYENGHTINCRWLAGIALATNRNLAKWPETIPKTPKSWGNDEWETLKASGIAQPIECDLAFTSALTNTMSFVKDYGLRGRLHTKERFVNTISSSRLGMGGQQIVMVDSKGNGVPGACFYVPLFRPEVSGLIAEVMQTRYTNWSHRANIYWLHFTSVIVAPVDYNFLAWSISEEAPDDIKIELFSSTNQVTETWLNIDGPIPRAADPHFRPYLSHRQRWLMYGKKFSIFFYTTPLFEAQSPRRFATIAMGAGTLLTLMATTLVGIALRSRDRQEELTDQIREARDALAAAQKAREQFSRDLHDGTIQSLYAIQLGLGHLVGKLEDEPADTRKQFTTVRKELDAVIAEIRNFINAGEVADTHVVSLTSVLAAVVQRAQAGASARIILQCDKEAAAQLSAADAVQLANIAREAISNSLRHAKPARVDVSLRIQDEALVLVVRDDGTGFDPDSPQRFGVGLNSMRTRAVEIGGSFSMASSPSGGTRIQISIPTHHDANT